jgi:hypothetical protein
MKTKRLFLMLALLMTAVAGAWADEIVMTTADIGKVICTDRSFYPTVADAQAAGKTPVAMIAYLDEVNCKGLAISLEDGPITSNTNTDNPIDGCKINTAINIANSFNTTHAVEGGTWRVPTVNDWEHMFIGCGSTSTYVEYLPYQTLLTADTPYFSSGNIREMMVAAGGKPFYASYISRGYWTVNDQGGISGDMRWAYFFQLGIGQDNYICDVFDGEVQAYVRPCLEFTLPGYAHYLTFAEGTKDVEHWSIAENPIVKGKAAILKYSGNKVVKSVTLAKSGGKGYSPHVENYLRRPDWLLTMPDYDDEIVVEYEYEDYTTVTRSEDQTALLEEMDGKTNNVLVDLVIPQGWSVVSFPFDIPAGTYKSSYHWCFKQFVGSSYFEGKGSAADETQSPTIKLYFEDVTEVKAGRPYLMQGLTNVLDLFNVPVMDATISKTPHPVSSKYVDFIPTLTRTFIEGDPQKIIFLEPNTNKEDFISDDYIWGPPFAVHPLELPFYSYGLSGYFQLTNEKIQNPEKLRYEVVFGPYEPEPISEKTEEKPGDFAKADEVVTTESGITYVLSIDDTVNPEDGSITMTATMTADEMKKFLETSAPGWSALYDTFKGIYFLLSAGKGKVEVDIETMDAGSLAALIGLVPQDEYTLDGKGTLTFTYDVTEATWMFIFPVIKSGDASARSYRAPAEPQGSVKIYGIRVIPENDNTGIKETLRSMAGNGHIYNINGQRVNTLKKGLYIIDGRKMVVK